MGSVWDKISKKTDEYVQQVNKAKKQIVDDYAKQQLKSGVSARDVRNASREYMGLPESVVINQRDKQKEILSNASRNASNILKGNPLELYNGKLYSNSPISSTVIQNSIDYANNEIRRLKSEGSTGNVILENLKKAAAMFSGADQAGTLAGALTKDASDDYDEITRAAERIRELESYAATLEMYKKKAKQDETLQKIGELDATKIFEDLYNLDTNEVYDGVSKAGGNSEEKPFNEKGPGLGTVLADIIAGESTQARDSVSIRRNKLLGELKNKGLSEEDIDEFRSIYADSKNQKLSAEMNEFVTGLIEKSPFLASTGLTAGNILMSSGRGFGSLIDLIAENNKHYGFKTGNFLEDVSGVTQSNVLDQIDKNINIKPVAYGAKLMYQAAVSAGETMMRSLGYGKVAEIVAGIGAASSSYKYSIERGLSEEKALSTALAAGIFEGLFEHISLEKLRMFKASPETDLKGFIRNFFSQSFTEGMEEVGTELANTAYDYLINGGLSDYEQALQMGITPEEYARDFANTLGETFAVGALAGGGMGAAVSAPGTISHYVNERADNVKRGEAIKESDRITEVVDEAKSSGVKTKGIENKKGEINLSKLGKTEKLTENKQAEQAVDEVLASEEYGELSKKDRNAIRSSVLTFLRSPSKLSSEQTEVLEGENGKAVLKSTYGILQNKAADSISRTIERKVSQKIKEGNSAELVTSTFEGVDSSGSVVEAGAVASVGENGIEIVIDKETGATSQLSEINIRDERAASLYKAIEKNVLTQDAPLSANAANVILALYDTAENSDTELYVEWAHDVYKAAQLKMTFDEFNDMFTGEYEADISKYQLQKIYSAGISSMEVSAGLTVIGHKGLSKSASEQVFLIDRVFKKYGLEGIAVNGRLTDGDGNSVNGLFKTGSNRIVLNINSEYGLISVAAGEEMFHWLKDQNPAMGTYLQDLVIGILKSDSKYDYKGIFEEVSGLYEGLSEGEILEEIAAHYMGVVFSSEANINRIVNEAGEQERSFLRKIIDHLKEFVEEIKNLLKVYGTQNKTVKAAMEASVEELSELARMFDVALSEVAENKKSTESDGGVKASLSREAKESQLNAHKNIFGGNMVPEYVGTGVRYSLTRSREIGEASIKKNNSLKNVKNEILYKGIEVMNAMADVMKPYLDKDGILPPDNYKKSTIFKNGSYGRTGENTTVCVRTLTYEHFKDMVSKKLGRPLSVAESLLCSQKIIDIATYPQCIYCYVAADRKAYDEYLGKYWNEMDKYVKALSDGGDSDALFNEYLDGRESTKRKKERWEKWKSLAKSGKSYISQADLATREGRQALKDKGGAFAEQVKDAESYAQSASWAKRVEDYRAYNGEILRMKAELIKQLNEEYGFRMYSFSDYTPAFIVENMQMIIDASVRGLKSLAYTKDTDYAKIFAKTGQAINVSCYAEYNKEFGTFVEDSRQGASWEETKKLRAQNENVGAVMVCTNDRMVQWALKQDWIDVVIPYHIVKTGTTIANEYEWRNYTADSADKKDGKNANIYPTEHDNKFEIYQRLVEERGITPRFNKWYMMARDGKITGDEYMKLVNEVKLPASELKPVKPEFNLEAAMESFGINDDGSLIEGGFVDKGGYMGGWYKDGVNVSAEVEAVASDIEDGKRSVDVEYGMSRDAKIKAEEKHGLKYSRQRLSDSWDEIRDMMNLYEVHDEVITAIEEHIEKIKSRQLSRETALTEGLIPKYEEVLEVARDYTKNSTVSAHTLADAVNELMWAAHDGNLDTKQFISTVKGMMEEVIKTGNTVNDDLYKEYAEFRKMTREETVYVSQDVYDQYVEEYGSVRNLTREIQGKIRIKPYKGNDRTGRALDGFYSELQERFPGLIRDDADIYHQLYRILDAWAEIMPVTTYYSEMLGATTENEISRQAILMSEDLLSEVLHIKESVKTIADKYAERSKAQGLRYKEYYRQMAERERQARRDRDEINVLRTRIERNCKHLESLIRNETDQRHVPEKMKEPVMNFLNMFRGINSDGREVLISGGTLNFVELENSYDEYFNPVDESTGEKTPKASYDEDVAEWIHELALELGDETDIKKLRPETLEKVDKIILHFKHIINHENEIFVSGKRRKFAETSKHIIDQMYGHVGKDEYSLQKKISDFEYKMQTPVYFFKNIGTKTVNGEVQHEVLYEMFNDIRNGHDQWFRNIEKTRNRLEEIQKEYHYDSSWKKQAKEFTVDSGQKVKLTPEEIMYMRAVYIRENGHINNLNHLLEGGIITESDGKFDGIGNKIEEIKETRKSRKEFQKKGGNEKDKIVDSLKINLKQEDLIMIFATLTDDMKKYGDALVEMLSVDGSRLGNKVSMELFGIKKFTEKKYIPLSVASDFISKSLEKRTADTAKIKNRSFTKRTVSNANATIYVKGITDIAVGHMQEMGLYNAMTVPLENLSRVLNYQLPSQEEIQEDGTIKVSTGNSLREIFRAIYGDRGIKYLDDFLKDMNGGNQVTARDFMSKMLTTFKRSAVTGSLSVAIQQPSAVARALAMVDARYFVPKPFSTKDYREMLEYNPVAGIKEIGRFDTGLGMTATEWILNEEGNFLDKAENLLMALPGQMDKMTWTYIWNAVKRETKAKNKNLEGEVLLKKAAERFRDVIDYTQVYDSTLSRNAFMRDQGYGAKAATSFMAEPALSYNLLRDSIRNAKDAPKQCVRGIAAFTSATLLNAILKSLITALRRDDEESNYFEVYISQAVENFLGDIDPLGLVPVVKDVFSIIDGYSVARPDMTLVENLLNSAKAITKTLEDGKLPTWEEMLTFVGTATAFTRIPLNNVFKDFIAIYSTVSGIKGSPEFSLSEIFAEKLELPDSERIYNAIVNNDAEALERYKGYDEKSVERLMEQGYSEEEALLKAMDNADSNFHSKVIEGLISKDIRIQQAADARLSSDTASYNELIEELIETGFEKNDVIKAINKYIDSLEEKTYASSEEKVLLEYGYADLVRAIDNNNDEAVDEIYAFLRENGTSQDSIQNHLKNEYADDVYRAKLNGNDKEYEKYKALFEKFYYSIDKVMIQGLKENDEDIRRAAEARYNLDFETYQEISNSLINKGFYKSNVYNAIESLVNGMTPKDESDSTYISEPDYSYETEYADMHRAIAQGDMDKMRYVIYKLQESGVKASSIKGSLSGKYRTEYIEAVRSGDEKRADEIEDILYEANVGYTAYNFRSWREAAAETE